ncbi:MAG: LysR substrate-binding domain-containing protein [Pseudomonadota bacterium]
MAAMVTLRQLRYFVALTEHLHFGRASSALNVTQPALSMQIRELEDQLGVTLCERRGKGVLLTPEGDEIARRARSILLSVEDMENAATVLREPLTGNLRLGIIPSVAPYFLPALLPLLDEEYPDLRLQVREAQTQFIVEDLQEGRLDVVIIALPAPTAEFESEPIFDDPFFLAVQAESVPATDVCTALDLLQPEKLLLLEEGHCLRDQALNFCDMVSEDLADRFGASSLTTLLQLVANGRGMTLLPEICVGPEAETDRIRLLTFPEPVPKRQIGLAWRRTSSRHEDFQTLAGCMQRARSQLRN